MPAAASKEKASLDPLKDLLGDVLQRLEALEAAAGLVPPPAAHAHHYHHAPVAPVSPKPSTAAMTAAGEVPAVKAYDAYVKSAVTPFAAACDGVGLGETGKLLVRAWGGVRTVVVLASRSKAPAAEEFAAALQPHLGPTQDAAKAIPKLKLSRDLDRHVKAVTEMMGALSWVFYKPPQMSLPAAFVKECQGSVEFWTNRLRKDFKDDPKQLAFCDAAKAVLSALADYIQTYHKTGLTFNPRGVSLAEAAIRLTDEPAKEMDIQKSPAGHKRHPIMGNAVPGGNMAGLMGELASRKSADGSSAATGLKHVGKDQQTWRKEFKKDEVAKPKSSLPAAPGLDASLKKKKEKKKPLMGLPIFEYQDRGFKWVVENHTKESVIKEASKDGIITVEISDPKQQVYLYNCDGVTVKVNGKFKSLVLDKCENCAVVYDTLISGAEMVNCKKIQLQVIGVCPVFTIDKTINVLVYLSSESINVSTFTTSLSSEMNVSFPDGDDQKEMPIPEQFVHKLKGGSVTSDVSDLYH